MLLNRLLCHAVFHICWLTLTILVVEAHSEQPKPLLTISSTFLGSGYDLRVGNPDGYSLHKGGIDPGLKLFRNVLRITNDVDKYTEDYCPAEGVCTALTSTETRTLLIDDLSKYEEELGMYWTLLEDPNESSKPGFEGSGSRVLNELKQILETEKYAMLIEDMRWIRGAAEYNRTHLIVTNELKSELCNLPLTLNIQTKPAFKNFLERWGTHVVVQVILGERRVKRSLFTEGDYLRRMISTPSYKFKIKPTILTNSDKSFLSASSRTTAPYLMQFIQNDKSSKPFITFPIMEYGSRSSPVPLSMHLQSLSSFISESSIDLSQGSCSHLTTDTLESLRTNVETATREYVGEGKIPAREDIIRGVQLLWPSGSYSLPMSRSLNDCPPSWVIGSRYHDLEDTAPALTSWSVGLNLTMKGEFAQNSKLYFCSKTTPDITSTDDEGFVTSWDAGSYCVYKKGSCPTGFVAANIYMNDEDSGNGNKVEGILPDGIYGVDTRYDICCRTDGKPSSPIVLPTQLPFFLLPTSSVCQQVVGMKSVMHWLLFDTDNVNPASGGSRIEGTVQPFGSVNSNKDLKLHFCYYIAG